MYMLGETVERTEYEELKKEMNERFGNVESRLQNLENKVENVRVSLDAKIDVVKSELGGKICSLEGKMYGLEREIGHTKWVLYVGFTILGIFSGLTLKYAMENKYYNQSKEPAKAAYTLPSKTGP
jgi:tRNA U54 and U55 pseudouridine synthase Pus10